MAGAMIIVPCHLGEQAPAIINLQISLNGDFRSATALQLSITSLEM
jgi:hypothetical protein